MLSLFPQLLFLAPLGLTIIRISAGLSFMYMGWKLFNNRSIVKREGLPVIGRAPEYLTIIGSVIEFALGVLLAVGLWTQLAALLCAVGAIKGIIWSRTYPEVFPLPRSSQVLLLAICLALVVSGAGAFGFDLPL